ILSGGLRFSDEAKWFANQSARLLPFCSGEEFPWCEDTCSIFMLSLFSRNSFRQKLSHGLPAARTLLLSDTIPFESAPIAALESISRVHFRFLGMALITQAAAANSAIKFFL